MQFCIGLLLGISLIMQVEYSEKSSQKDKSSIIREYSNLVNNIFENNETFLNVSKRKNSIQSNETELLTKSKREKVLVTEDY